METGYVSLVGAGCGDPELLTLKALKRLRHCEVLVYDSLASSEIIAQAPQDCEKIYAGKRYGRHAMRQEQINALLIQKAREGKRVVRLKGGDPYVFGRGGEEFLALDEAGIFCEEIPGITSAIAVPAAAGIPVTHRGLARSVTVLTGTAAGEDGQEGLAMDFEALAGLEGTLVILMGMHHLAQIAKGLMEAGKDASTPCAVIMDGTIGAQKSVRAPLFRIAREAKEAGLAAPAVIVIGAVAGLCLCCDTVREGVDPPPFLAGEAADMRCSSVSGEADMWHLPVSGEADMRLSPLSEEPELSPFGTESEGLPLHGVRVGVTGTPHFFGKLSALLQKKGAAVEDFSFLEVRENPAALPVLSGYGWLVFTSPNGVRIFLDKLRRERRDLRCLSTHRIAVIGPGTAAVLEEAGIFVDYMPAVYDARHLAEGLTALLCAPKGAAGIKRDEECADAAVSKPALFLRARQGSDALPEGFVRRGLSFAEFPLYEICVNEEKRGRMGDSSVDYLVFGAGSGVRAWFAEREASGFAEWEQGMPDFSEREQETSGFTGQKRKASAFAGRYVCMGEACGRELARFTKARFLTAAPSSAEGIVDCICRDAEKRKDGE